MLTSADDSRLEPLFDRLHAAVDVPAYWAAVQSILNEVSSTPRWNDLLRQLHLHVETTAQRVTAREARSAVQRLRRSRLVAASPGELSALMSQLTPAEHEIFELVRNGLSNKQIAYELHKSIRTVKTQLTSVYKKVGVRSRSQLLARLS